MPTVRQQRRRNSTASRITATARVEITGADATSGDATPRFNMVAYTGEPMRIYSWSDPVIVDLETADLTEQRIPALYDHWADMGSVVGQVDSLAIKDQQLVASGSFTIPPPDPNSGQSCAARVLALAKAGYQWQASVGADPATVEEIKAGAVGVANWGRKYAGPCVIGRGCKFRELSFVVLGGDRRTKVVTARSIRGNAMTFEQWLLSMGFDDPTTLTDVQRANLEIAFNEANLESAEETQAETPAEEPVAAEGDASTTTEEEEAPVNAAGRRPAVRGAADPAIEHRRRVAAEESRIDSVRRICAAAGNPEIEIGRGANRRRVGIQAHAIEQGWDADTTRREVELAELRASRADAPAAIVRTHERDCTLQALQGAMILRAGGRLDHPAYQSPAAAAIQPNGQPLIPNWLRMGINAEARQRTMEAAYRYAEYTALDLCRESCRIDGRRVNGGRSSLIEAAVSGMSLTSVFTTNINAILLATYMEAPDTTMGWTREQDVNDYRLQERPRMLKGGSLAKRTVGGTADHMARSDSGESYRIASYAGQIELDEQDFINNHLGAFSDIPVEMGLAARRLRPDLVYAIILSNPTLATTSRSLFNSTDGNLLTSAALAAATLRAAVKAQSLFTENSVNLNLLTTHLIVPPSLRHLGLELSNSPQIIIAGTAGSVTERGSANALLADALTVVSDARLENGVVNPADGTTESGSATSWYTAAAMAHTIEVGYLAGTGRAPRVRSWKHTGEGKYGMGWDVEMSIGAKELDWKGLTKSTA